MPQQKEARNMNTTLLMQLLQNMNDPNYTHETHEEGAHLPPPFDMLLTIRPMLPPREQRMIDVMIKVQELRILIDEMQNEI